MAFPDSSNLTTIVVEGIGGVVENAAALLQTLQDNPLAVVVTAAAVVAVAVVGRAVLPCGRPAPVKPKAEEVTPELPKPKPKPKKAPTLAIVDLWGVYQPVSVLLPKDAVTTAKHSTYKSGYKSADDKGRVFNFHAAPVDPGTMDWTKQKTWDDLKARNTQEFIVIAEVKEGDALPAFVTWSWSAVGRMRGSRDADDASQTGLRFAAVDGQALTGDGSDGTCRAPVWDKTITLDGKQIPMHISAVKVVCTYVGGDAFQIKAKLPQDEFDRCGGAGTPPSDETGTIRVWKRIDVEYLYMKAASLPVDSVPKYYEPAFVQMDIAAGKEIPKVAILSDSYSNAQVAMAAIATTHAVYAKRIGWFLLVACYSAYTPTPVAGDEVTRYAASHCNVTVWTREAAGQELGLIQGAEFGVGSQKTKAAYKKHGKLRGVILAVAKPATTPAKIRLFKNKATEAEDENYVDFQVASLHAYPEDAGKTVAIVEPEDYCTDFQPNTWAKDRKLLMQYPKDTVVVNYTEDVTWLGRGGFSYPNAFSAKFVYSGARNLRGHSAARNTDDGPVVLGQLFIFTTHNSDKKSQETAIVHEFCHAIGLYLPHKCGLVAAGNLGAYPAVHGFARFSCCMNYRSTLLYRDEHQSQDAQLDQRNQTDRLIEAWDKGTDVPDFCYRHRDAIELSIFEKNTEIWNW